MSEIMTYVDNFWLHMDHPTNLMIITGLLEFEGPADYNIVLKQLEKRFLIFDRFKKKIIKPGSGMGMPVWKYDHDFDIRSHVHRLALPDPGNRMILQEIISDLASTPLDETKPLWQMYLIENYNGGSALFVKIHHCIGDGTALIHVLLSMTDEDPESNYPGVKLQIKSPYTRKKQLSPFLQNIQKSIHLFEKVTKKIKNECTQALENPAEFVKKTTKATIMATDFMGVLTKLAMMSPDPKTVFKGKLGVRKKLCWADPFNLKDVKIIGTLIKATINDVLISSLTGGLREYLLTKNNRINGLDLRVAVPVNIRKPGDEYQLGNKFSLIFLSLPVHEEDPVMRLREVKRRMDDLKASPDAIVAFQALNTLGLSPAVVARKGAFFLANKSTAIMTNVPGPKKTLYFAGNKINNVMFWVPRMGKLSLGISIISYDNKVSLGLAADSGLIADPEIIFQGFKKEFNKLLAIAQSGKIDEKPLVINYMDKEPIINNKAILKKARLEHEPFFYPRLSGKIKE